jgi:TonB family protein
MALVRTSRRGGWYVLTVLFALAGIFAGLGSGQTADNRDPATQKSEEPVVALGPGITPPRVIHQVSPDVNSGAGGFRVSGVVVIELVVSSRGLPREVHVAKPLDKDLDKSAIMAVEQWRFQPAMRSDSPVAVRITIEIRFRDL